MNLNNKKHKSIQTWIIV